MCFFSGSPLMPAPVIHFPQTLKRSKRLPSPPPFYFSLSLSTRFLVLRLLLLDCLSLQFGQEEWNKTLRRHEAGVGSCVAKELTDHYCLSLLIWGSKGGRWEQPSQVDLGYWWKRWQPTFRQRKRQVASLVDSITFTEGRGDEEETKKPAFTATPHPPPSLNLLLCRRHILTLPRASSSSANITTSFFWVIFSFSHWILIGLPVCIVIWVVKH